MTAAKQLRGNAGKGRKKGIPNRVTADVKQMVLIALQRAGGAQYLEEQAHRDPVAFMSLVGRVLPLQVRDPEGINYCYCRCGEGCGAACDRQHAE